MTRAAALLLPLVLALAACGQAVSYDKEVDDLGARIVAHLKELPPVSAATYVYEHGLDLGQHLRVRVILDQDSAGAPAVEQAIDTAARTFWLSPARVGHLVITVYSTGNPPQGDSDTDKANADRAIGVKNIEDSRAFDRPEMERRYGPRPTR